MSTYVYGITRTPAPPLPDGLTGVGDPPRPVRVLERERQRRAAAHRVAHQRDLLQPQVVQHRPQVLVGVVVAHRGAGAPVRPRLVADQLVLGGELELLVPHRHAEETGVQQHQRRTVADDVVADVEVVGADVRHRRDATAPVRAVRAGSRPRRGRPPSRTGTR